MKTKFLPLALVAAGITLAWPHQASAIEHLTPYLPGATTGTPAGALPEAGFYFMNDMYFISGEVVNSAGATVASKTLEAADAPLLLWVPGNQILGATYSASLKQAFAMRSVDASGIGGASTATPGFFNAIITPAILSWNLGQGLHASTGLGVYLPDGHYSHVGTTTSQDSCANNFWTLQPNFAVSYLRDGWNLTVNTLFNFNTTNPTTNYYSGDSVYFDETIAKSIGHMRFGLIGNYSEQFTDDTKNGEVYKNGHTFQSAVIGPMVAYDIGHIPLMARYLAPIYTRNTLNATMVHFSAQVKF